MTVLDELIVKINYVNIDKSKREIFNKIKEMAIFKKSLGNPELFSLCVVLGKRHSKREKLSNSSGLFRVTELRDYLWNLLAIAYSENEELDLFENQEGIKQSLKICEEYANAGIDILNEMLGKNKDFFTDILSEVIND